jgi:hypothetical protein
LNNPDISKIIGEQWKAESDEQKKYWQNLAQVGLLLPFVLSCGMACRTDAETRKKRCDITSSIPTTATSLAALANLARRP